jgi:hypothetical protein
VSAGLGCNGGVGAAVVHLLRAAAAAWTVARVARLHTGQRFSECAPLLLRAAPAPAAAPPHSRRPPSSPTSF